MSGGYSVSGSCLCGDVRFTAQLPSLFCGHCHCTMCRRAHGAGFVTWFAVSRDRFSLDAGNDQLVRFDSSDHGTRSFCNRCGSTLFCESSQHPDRIDLVLSNVSGPIDRAPGFHCFYDDRASWIVVRDGLQRLGGATGLEPMPDSGDAG
jgi:hypothetical protein